MLPSWSTIILLLLISIVGITTGNHPLGLIAVIILDLTLLLFFLIDYNSATKLTKKIKMERNLPSVTSAGSKCRVVIKVKNTSREKLTMVMEEALPSFLHPSSIAFGKIILDPEEEKLLEYQLSTPVRGEHTIGPCSVRIFGKMKLALKQCKVLPSQPIKVYPDTKQIEGYQALVRFHRLREMGLCPSRKSSAGTMFESLREFMEGDEPSKIEWKATARKSKLIVKNFEEEKSQNIFILIDSGKMMTTMINGQSKLDYAIDSALLLSFVTITKGDNVGLILFADRILRFIPPARSTIQVKKIAEALYNAKPLLVEPDYINAVKKASTTTRKRSLIIIFTEMGGKENAKELLGALKNIIRHHLQMVVMIKDKQLEKVSIGVESFEKHDKNFQMASASRLLQERQEIIETMKRQGAIVLDLYPHQIKISTIRKYLELKLRNLT